MQQIALYIPTIEKSNSKSERAELIGMFVTEINRERPCYYKDKNGKKKKLDLITPRAVAIKLSILKTNQELREFFSECKDYHNRGQQTGNFHNTFSRRFFGGFKAQNWY